MKIVIFCGGFGTRMWPASRKSHPKQFYPIMGGKSFFQITLERFLKGFDITDIYVSTEQRYTEFIKKQAPDLPSKNIIAEPERRDLLAAIGLVTATIEKRHPGEVMFFSWSDHFIKNEKKFIQIVKAAGTHCKETGTPVSVDEEPTFPTIHSGWLKMGRKIEKNGNNEYYEIDKHIEKPTYPTAKRLFKSDKYLIHTGNGAWRSDIMLGFYKKYAQPTHRRLAKMMEAMGTSQERKVINQEYAKIKKISVEFALYENLPAHSRLTIPMRVGWQDLGTWQLFYEALTRRKSDKTLIEGGPDTEFIDSEDNLIFGKKGKIISIIGLSNIAVIDTDNGLLISRLDKTKDVKKVFANLEKKKPKYVD